MAQRSVFKIAGSLGPAGSIVTLMEKLCRRLFREAYEYGDESIGETVEEKKIKELRENFVNDVFDMKGKFNSVKAKSALMQVKAYVDLHKLINKYKKQIYSLEKTKLTRLRIAYLRDEDQQKYDECLAQETGLEENIYENLKKMAFYVLEP